MATCRASLPGIGGSLFQLLALNIKSGEGSHGRAHCLLSLVELVCNRRRPGRDVGRPLQTLHSLEGGGRIGGSSVHALPTPRCIGAMASPSMSPTLVLDPCTASPHAVTFHFTASQGHCRSLGGGPRRPPPPRSFWPDRGYPSPLRPGARSERCFSVTGPSASSWAPDETVV